MKEWIDERILEGLAQHEYTIINKDWENTLAVDKNKLADNPGFITPRIKQLAFQAARHPNKLVINALVDGNVNLCYDGQAFFADAHPQEGSGVTFDNLLAGSGVTVANIQTDWQQIVTAWMKTF